LTALRYIIPVSGVIGSTDDTGPFAVRYREPDLTLVASLAKTRCFNGSAAMRLGYEPVSLSDGNA